MQTKEQSFFKLSKSKFRSSFYLTKAEKEYVKEKGFYLIKSHARDFVKNKLAPAHPFNDGSQTPMHGHPVFKAMHATAFCCRGCMEKWYKVPQGVELSTEQQEKIVNFLLYWIKKTR